MMICRSLLVTSVLFSSILASAADSPTSKGDHQHDHSKLLDELRPGWIAGGKPASSGPCAAMFTAPLEVSESGNSCHWHKLPPPRLRRERNEPSKRRLVTWL